jgi:hypothetical protein
MLRAFLRKVLPESCGCGRPATEGGYFCNQCRAGLTNPEKPYDEFAQQHALAAKLNSLSSEEWNRIPILGMPSRLLH